MNLSDLQNKEIVDISTGKRLGYIIDVIIDRKGLINKLILEKSRSNRKLFVNNKEEIGVLWQEIVRIGDDIILVKSNNMELER